MLLHYTAHTGSRELFRLAVLAIALGVAAGAAYLFGVSLALGAFFAGMILAESELSHRAAEESLPLRDAFAVLFFVAVGMLFDPSVLLARRLPMLATVLIILFGKSAGHRVPVARRLPAQSGDGSLDLRLAGADRRIFLHERRQGNRGERHARRRTGHRPHADDPQRPRHRHRLRPRRLAGRRRAEGRWRKDDRR
jgi:hypothetical protein